ncbi:MAG: hypothetical protein JST83_08650 [Bacteroidetes bacterium]|nr:hypothetical protein [Bacteroidota bacterium]
MEHENPVILALYPNSIGIGYACLQIPGKLLDFGVTTSKPISNGKLLRRAEKFMDYYKPKLVLLKEVAATATSRRNDKLIEALATLSGEMGLSIYRYTNQQISDTFEVFGARTKYEMVDKIVQMLPDLKTRMPKVRKWYEKEDYNMVVFKAVALAITHCHLSE